MSLGKIICPECKCEAYKEVGFINRAKRKGNNIYCGRRCFSKNLSKQKTIPNLSPWRHRNREKIAGRPCPSSCEVCGSTESRNKNLKHRMHFDHDHESNKFRGWLCGNCNKILGLSKDNPEHLRLLIKYLEDYNANSG